MMAMVDRFAKIVERVDEDPGSKLNHAWVALVSGITFDEETTAAFPSAGSDYTDSGCSAFSVCPDGERSPGNQLNQSIRPQRTMANKRTISDFDV